MQVFSTPEGNYKELTDKYKKYGETARISIPIEFEGKKYSEVVYKKTFLGKMKRNIEGIIFLNEDGEYVSNSRLKNELSSLGYHLDVMLDDKSIDDLKGAITPELEIEKQLIDYEQITKAIENMPSVAGTDPVIAILNKLPNLKKENNKAIETYLSKLQELKQEGFVFDTAVYDELYAYYREILVKNFQRVRLVATGRSFYDDIKREAQKRKRSLSYRFNKEEIIMGLAKLPYEIDHLKKIVTIYEKVSNMKQEEYIKYLKTVEKNNIKNRIELVR